MRSRLLRLHRVWLEKLLAPADDPRVSFADGYEKQRTLLAKVRQAQEKAAVSKTLLLDRTAELLDRLPELEEQARQSLLDKREDKARAALQLRKVTAGEVRELVQKTQEVSADERALSLVDERLASKMEALAARREAIEARYSTAEAQVRIQETLTGASEELSELGVELDRAEQRAEQLKASVALDQMAALSEIVSPEGGSRGNEVREESQAAELLDVEEDLAALKRQLGLT